MPSFPAQVVQDVAGAGKAIAQKSAEGVVKAAADIGEGVVTEAIPGMSSESAIPALSAEEDREIRRAKVEDKKRARERIASIQTDLKKLMRQKEAERQRTAQTQAAQQAQEKQAEKKKKETWKTRMMTRVKGLREMGRDIK